MGGGGAAMGYYRAGFDVIGVDVKPQPRYPFTFVQGDALSYLSDHGRSFVAVHASPPCKDHTAMVSRTGGDGSGWLLPAVRDLLINVGSPYVIENVEGAPMVGPFKLCGSEFQLTAQDIDGELLQLQRHRLFESNIPLAGVGGCQHAPGVQVAGVYGGTSRKGHRSTGGGYRPTVAVRRELMGIDWMTRDELNEAIPPAYTEHIGRQLIKVAS